MSMPEPLKGYAVLTDEEEAVWNKLFSHNLNSGMDEQEADQEAWRGLREQFPRLRNFKGCV